MSYRPNKLLEIEVKYLASLRGSGVNTEEQMSAAASRAGVETKTIRERMRVR